MTAIGAAVAEVGKLPAFVRRDLLIALSRRSAFATDLLLLGAQMVVFFFISRLVDRSVLPAYGGDTATYLEFAGIGIVLGVVVGVLLWRVANALRKEQRQGTLEALLAAPAAVSTVQVGAVALDLLLVPIRMALLLLIVALIFGLELELAGAPQSAVLLLALLPCVWGLGLLSAAAIMTFKRGAVAAGAVIGFLGIASGAYFPLTLLPAWLEMAGRLNPFASTLEAMRDALLGDASWGSTASDLAELLPVSAVVLVAGVVTFRLALSRVRRNGTLALD